MKYFWDYALLVCTPLAVVLGGLGKEYNPRRPGAASPHPVGGGFAIIVSFICAIIAVVAVFQVLGGNG